jgi:hypothetical protein
VTIKRETRKTKWQKAIDEGAVTVDEFFDEVRIQIEGALQQCVK